MGVTFTSEYIGKCLATRPIFVDGVYVGLIDGPASTGRKTWQANLYGRRLGRFATCGAAEDAVRGAALYPNTKSAIEVGA